jgi:tellurite resistance protein TehA-like permease
MFMEKKGFTDSIRHFTPTWFAANMGTGIISLLFSVFPYWGGSAMRGLSTAFFFLNLVLFILFCAATVARYWRFPGMWGTMLRHPVESLYLGTFPMGAVTLVGVATTVLHGQYGFGGRGFLYTIWAFWWVDMAVSALCCWGIIYVMITKHELSLRDVSTLWLLPIITLIVGSSPGGELVLALNGHAETGALTTLATTACTLSVGLGLACAILVVYLCRLILYGFPAGSVGVLAACVPLGPMGQSGVAVLFLGEGARALIPVAGSQSPFLGSAHVGECIYAICVCTALALWALATLWLGFALLCMQYNVRRMGVPPFQLAYWSLIFPNGVYANLTILLYQVLHAGFFRVWGAIYAVFTLLLYIFVFYKTATLVPSGRIFDAPSLQRPDATATTAMASMSTQTIRAEQQQKQHRLRAGASSLTVLGVGDDHH